MRIHKFVLNEAPGADFMTCEICGKWTEELCHLRASDEEGEYAYDWQHDEYEEDTRGLQAAIIHMGARGMDREVLEEMFAQAMDELFDRLTEEEMAEVTDRFPKEFKTAPLDQ